MPQAQPEKTTREVVIEQEKEQSLLDCCVENTPAHKQKGTPWTEIEIEIQAQSYCCGVWSDDDDEPRKKLKIKLNPDGTFSGYIKGGERTERTAISGKLTR